MSGNGTPKSDAKPQPFGKYQLVRKIGSGGMAEVFLAKSFGAEGLEKELVIKRIHPAFAQKQRFVSMFIDEANIAFKLNHPNIVQVYDFGKVANDYYLAMEFVDGHDLARLISRLRNAGLRFPLGDAIHLAIELCKGLDYAHRKRDEYGEPLRIVHRDISPQNLLVSKDGNLKIVDFGIAKARIASSEKKGVIKGKFSYMSPEQAIGGEVDHRSDIFAAGVVLFELIFARPLFRFTTQEETLTLVKSAILPDLSQLEPRIPDEVERVLFKALDKVPDRRYASARDMQVALTRVLFGLGEIHDAQTLAAFLSELDEKAPDTGGNENLSRTVVPVNDASIEALRTATFGQRPKSDRHASLSQISHPELTPITPVMLGDVSQIGSDSLREKKDVVCVAGHITGLQELRDSVGDEHIHSLIVELMRIVEAIAFKMGALVEQFNESSFLLVLGLPAASENDAERSLWMALDLHEAIAGINLNIEAPILVSIGIALGRALVTRDLSSRIYEREILGDVDVLSHQIATEAMPREILLGGRVFQRVRRAFHCELLKEIPFPSENREDRPNPSVYRLTRPKSRKERLAELKRSYSVLYGRELELKLLRERFQRSQLERTCLGILIEGEMGIGKSALVAEFLRGLSSSDGPDASIKLVRAVASHNLSDTPYAVLRQIVHELLGLDTETTTDIRAVAQRIENIVSTHMPGADPLEHLYLTHALGFFFDVKHPDSVIEPLDPARRRSRIFLSVRRLIEQMARRRPLLIVVEDLHHADASSIEFLASVIGNQIKHPIMLLATIRPLTEPALALERLKRAPNVDCETLGELSRRDAVQLVRDWVDGLELDREALNYVLTRAGGVPFYIIELLDALMSRGILEEVNGRLALGGSAADPWLPTSLEAVIAARIDQLDPLLKQALRRSSILGEEFDRRDAEFLFGDDFLALLDRLVELGLLRRVRSRGQEITGYRFAHTLTFEVAFREILWEERRELHSRMAEHLIADRHAPPGIIARHLEGAGRTEEASEHFFRAASDARDANSHIEALRLTNRALELVPEASLTRFDYLDLKEAILRALGRYEARLDILNHLIDLAQHRSTADHLTMLTRLAAYHIDRRDFDTARSLIEDVFYRARDGGHPHIAAKAKQLSSQILRDSGDTEAALTLAEEALAGFKATHSHVEAIHTQIIIGDTYWQMGRFDEAIHAFHLAQDAMAEEPIHDLEELIAVNLGLALVSKGDYERGLELYRKALNSCRAVGYQRREAGILPNLGHLYLMLGDPSRAERVLQRAITLASRTREDLVLADAVLTLAIVQLESGRLTRAHTSIKRGRRLALETQNTYLLIHAEIAMARLRLLDPSEASAEEAAAHAREAIALGEGANMRHGLLHGHHLLSLALQRLELPQDALTHSKLTLEHLQQHPVANPEALLFEQFELLGHIQPEATELRGQLIDRAAHTVEGFAARLEKAERRRKYLEWPPTARILKAWRDWQNP